MLVGQRPLVLPAEQVFSAILQYAFSVPIWVFEPVLYFHLMTEGPPNEDAGREQKRKELIALAIELSGNQEGFPFPGIDPEIYLGIKAALEKFPGYSTPNSIVTRTM